MASEQHCKHEGCTCTPRAGASEQQQQARPNGYCSQYCQDHAKQPAHAKHPCGCGHPGCGK